MFTRLIRELEDLDYELEAFNYLQHRGGGDVVAVHTSIYNPLRVLVDHTVQPARARLTFPAGSTLEVLVDHTVEPPRRRLAFPAGGDGAASWEIAFTATTPTPAQLVTLYAALNPCDTTSGASGAEAADARQMFARQGANVTVAAAGRPPGPGPSTRGADPQTLWGHLIRTLEAAGFTGQRRSGPDGLVGPILVYTAAHHPLRVVLDGAIDLARARLGVAPGVSTFGWEIAITATTPTPAQQVTLHAALHAEDPVAAVHAAHTVPDAVGAAEAAGGTLGVAAPSR